MHICFVALNSYNLFGTEKSVTHIGGAETQQCLMARWLVDHGHRVTVITRDHGQPAEEIADGIRIVKAYDAAQGLPILRFFVPRWSKLIRALGIADADVYYQRGAGFETGQVGLWCRRRRKPFVFGSASDSDCDSALPFLTKYRERALYRAGLRLATAIVVQSHRQASLLEASFGRCGEVVYSSGRKLGEAVAPAAKSNTVLWVGRLSPEKRFEWVLEIAGLCSNYRFLVLGDANARSEYARQMLDRAAALPNIEFIGYVAESSMVNYYNQARFVIVTSPIEGFPNVFLEAWQLGIPVISSVDPDGIVEANRLGWHVGSPQDAARLLAEYESRDVELDEIAATVRTYFEKNHTIDRNMPAYVELFRRVIPDD